jgi:porphobilinogen deaminase
VGRSPGVRLVDLRGNVDSRLRRLHEPRGSERSSMGSYSPSRVWRASGPMRPGRALLEELFSPLPRMVLPLSACPAAPAQGALGD